MMDPPKSYLQTILKIVTQNSVLNYVVTWGLLHCRLFLDYPYTLPVVFDLQPQLGEKCQSLSDEVIKCVMFYFMNFFHDCCLIDFAHQKPPMKVAHDPRIWLRLIDLRGMTNGGKGQKNMDKELCTFNIWQGWFKNEFSIVQSS